MNRYTFGWLAWGALFAIIEGHAIMNKRWEGTLSNHVRRWIGCGQKQTWWSYLRRGSLLGFLGWMGGHFVFGRWG